MEDNVMSARRRSLRAYLVEPFKQVRFGLHVVGWSLFYCLVLGGLFVRAFWDQYSQVVQFFNVANSIDLLDNSIFWRNAIIMGGVLLAFVATLLFVVFQRTHRMYGPMVNIERFLNEIQRGNYAARLRIRSKDDFQNLAAKLNEVAVELHRRHGVPADEKEGIHPAPLLPQDLDDGEESALITVEKPIDRIA
jgi:hypothetical protein